MNVSSFHLTINHFIFYSEVETGFHTEVKTTGKEEECLVFVEISAK